jgi:hypothetical protein
VQPTKRVDRQTGHARGAERIEVRVVVHAGGIVRVRAGLEMQPQGARRVRTERLDERRARAGHVDERDVPLGGRGARGVRVPAVRVDEVRALESPAHDRCEQHGMSAARAHLVDEAQEISAIVVVRRVVRRADLLVVVAELDEHVVTGLQAVDDRLPPPLGDERSRAPPIHRAIHDAHPRRIEARLERFPPAGLGTLVRLLLRHRRITSEPHGDRLVAWYEGSEHERREERAVGHAERYRESGETVKW